MKTLLSLISMAICAILNRNTASELFIALFYLFMIFALFFLFEEPNYSIKIKDEHFVLYIGSKQIDKSKSKALLIERNLETIKIESSL